jgi:hypothetical protein
MEHWKDKVKGVPSWHNPRQFNIPICLIEVPGRPFVFYVEQ